MRPSVRSVRTASSAPRARRRAPRRRGTAPAARPPGRRRGRAPSRTSGGRRAPNRRAADGSRRPTARGPPPRRPPTAPPAYSAPVSRMSLSVPCRSPSLARSMSGAGISSIGVSSLAGCDPGDERILLRAVGEVRAAPRWRASAHERDRLLLVLGGGEHADAGDVDERAEVLRREVDLDRVVGVLGLRLGDVVVVDQAERRSRPWRSRRGRGCSSRRPGRRWRPCPRATASRRPRPRRAAAP